MSGCDNAKWIAWRTRNSRSFTLFVFDEPFSSLFLFFVVLSLFLTFVFYYVTSLSGTFDWNLFLRKKRDDPTEYADVKLCWINLTSKFKGTTDKFKKLVYNSYFLENYNKFLNFTEFSKNIATMFYRKILKYHEIFIYLQNH